MKRRLVIGKIQNAHIMSPLPGNNICLGKVESIIKIWVCLGGGGRGAEGENGGKRGPGKGCGQLIFHHWPRP